RDSLPARMDKGAGTEPRFQRLGHLIITHLGLCPGLGVNQRLWREIASHSRARKQLMRSASGREYCAMKAWPPRGNWASHAPGMVSTSFNAFEGGITMSSLPVAISTGRVISDSRFPTPL